MCLLYSLPEESSLALKARLAACFRLNEERYQPFEMSERRYEIHRAYLDVQFVLSGFEDLLIADEKRFTAPLPFDEARDIAFFEDKPREDLQVHLRPGLFCVIFPGEAHLPCLRPLHAAGFREPVVKCVAKIPFVEYREAPERVHSLFCA